MIIVGISGVKIFDVFNFKEVKIFVVGLFYGIIFMILELSIVIFVNIKWFMLSCLYRGSIVVMVII